MGAFLLRVPSAAGDQRTKKGQQGQRRPKEEKHFPRFRVEEIGRKCKKKSFRKKRIFVVTSKSNHENVIQEKESSFF